MILLTEKSKILLATSPVDFRKQIDGLIAICQNELMQQPRSGTMFVFTNRSRTMIRILYYELNGYWLATKRLSKGRYPSISKLNHKNICSLKAHELLKIIKGVLAS
jgi:transposase